MKFSFINLGCKINQIEMEQASYGLVNKGYEYTDEIEASEFLLINTCTVTSKADRKSLQTIRKYSKYQKLKHVFVTGCYSELESDLDSKVASKNTIIAQKDKTRLPDIVDSLLRKEHGFVGHKPVSHDRFAVFKDARVSPESLESQQVSFFQHTRAFLKIQDGCNAFCSYCRIPFARGAPVSRDYGNIIDHVKRLRDRGIKEIVLSGINIGKYQDDSTGKRFSQLLLDLLDVAGEIRVKISSIEPFSLDSGFFDLLPHPNLAPHIHLPLQGLSDEILERMNRRYRLEDYQEIVNKIYDVRPDFSIATDVIVGYPGESELIYENGKAFLEACEISKIHVFPFSPRPLTNDYGESISQSQDYVPDTVKKQRVRNLMEFSHQLENRFIEKIRERHQTIIIETSGKSPTIKSNEPLGESLGESNSSWYQGTTEYNLKGWIPASSISNMKKNDSKSDVLSESQYHVGESGYKGYRGRSVLVKLSQLSPLTFEPISFLKS